MLSNIKNLDTVYIIAEIGLNHNGDIEIAKQLINVAASAGCNAVKFQKRTPEVCVPDDQKNIGKRHTLGQNELFGLSL